MKLRKVDFYLDWPGSIKIINLRKYIISNLVKKGNVIRWFIVDIKPPVDSSNVKKYDITPYGTESMHLLRAEKGFIIVGQDTDGSVTPKDINMDWIVSKKKEDFLGKRSFSRSDTRRTDRKQLVGILVNDYKTVLPAGSYVVDDA